MPSRIDTHVALVFGGRSPEHSISCLSANSVLAALQELGYSVTCIGITPLGVWVRVPSEEVAAYQISSEFRPEVRCSDQLVRVVMDPGAPGIEINGQFSPISILFPVIHGVDGEDGAIQGLCQIAGIPVVGSGVRASAISANKLTTKELVRAAGIDAGEWFAQYSGAISVPSMKPFPFPWFVKPVSGGSSIGISKVDEIDSFETACVVGFRTSSELIIEAGLNRPRELEVGILGENSHVQVSPVGEVKVKDHFEFYDFEAKYISDGAELIVPAQLPDEIAGQIQQLAVRVFTLLGCQGYARVDFFLEGDRIVFNEINTIPGFTSISMFAKMWLESGLRFPQIVDQLVKSAQTSS
ncbi:MAG: D-alanine--D-alanine ligase [Actinomycetia bacterium]|nr:D-alanine--D-alanine ligase [Actinomycetes bacterium]